MSNLADIYKILTKAEMLALVESGRFSGSADDRRDGFIHLSTRAQVQGTLGKHFENQLDLFLLGFSSEDFGSELRWEPSRGGALFPHLYSEIDLRRVKVIFPIARWDQEFKPERL